MPRPVPGSLWGREKTWRQKARRGLFSELRSDGASPFEEAVFTGVLAAEEAMDYLGHSYTTSIGEYAKRE